MVPSGATIGYSGRQPYYDLGAVEEFRGGSPVKRAWAGGKRRGLAVRRLPADRSYGKSSGARDLHEIRRGKGISIAGLAIAVAIRSLDLFVRLMVHPNLRI